MRIDPRLYVFVALALGADLWGLAIFARVFKPDILTAAIWLWAVVGMNVRRRPDWNPRLYSIRHMHWLIWMALGIWGSMVAAQLFWDQSLVTTAIAQRGIYGFVILIGLLKVQPNYDEVKAAVRWAAYLTMAIWGISIYSPTIIARDAEALELFYYYQEIGTSDLAMYINGYEMVLLHSYFSLEKMTDDLTWKNIVNVCLCLIFFILFQNRSMLIGLLLLTAVALFQIRSPRRPIVITGAAGLVAIAGLIFGEMLGALYEQSQTELGSQDYNRWKALDYYLTQYSPNWYCFVFGNGLPSAGNSLFGDMKAMNAQQGIFASDLGMIGMWADFGLLTVGVIYYVIATVIFSRRHALSLKYFGVHVLMVPTIFHFWRGTGVVLFSVYFYLSSFFFETKKIQEAGCK